MKKDKIKQVLDGMLNSINKDQIELYKSLVDKKCYDEITDAENFYFALIYPFESFLSGLIKTEISDNDDVEFIYKNCQFIDRHFETLFKNIEGTACCADKSRTIIERLVKFYKTGEKIEFNYQQEYTYHLPKIIFKTHKSIVEFYEGLKNLHYGNNEKYLKALLNLKEDVQKQNKK